KLKEERVRVGKQEVEAGGYRLRKVVRTEVVEQPVELRREELVIERVPVTEAGEVTEPIAEDEVYIPLRREEAVVGKDVRVREEVRAHKQVAVDTERVAEQVAREEVEVEKVDAEHVRIATTQDARPRV
ncbi:MAG TPA: YsnF/AvaK domain-containing protein, partial [Myxococcota bacterium]|nr:YsnF/AvaK domain-containing protein [Myxococcota bacterium]